MISASTTLTPSEFAREMNALVEESAPRMFAVVEETEDKQDGWVRAWGLAFEEDVVTMTPEFALVVHQSVTSARRFYQHGKRRITLRWLAPAVATPHHAPDARKGAV